MKAWYTAQELAGMPGMPSTERRVRAKADREHWHSRPRETGKGCEFTIDSLPAETRAHLIAKEPPQMQPIIQSTIAGIYIESAIERAAETQRKETSLLKYQTLPEKAKKRADIKLEILRTIDQASSSMNRAEAIAWLVANYEIYSEWKQVIPHISQASIYRWERSLRNDGISALSGQYSRHSLTLIEKEDQIHQLFLSVLDTHPGSSAVHVYDLLLSSLDPSIPKPSLRTVQRWLADWRKKNPGIYSHLIDPDRARGRSRPAMGNLSADVHRLNQRWELDSTPSDILLDGGRHTVIGCVDVWSRRGKFLIAKTSRATAIALLIRRCILDWGIPEEIVTDNGQDYVSKYLQRVLAALDITHSTCRPFSPWEKGHIERLFRTFSHGIAELLPGAIGHDVREQQSRRSRDLANRFMTRNEVIPLSLDPSQFQSFCDAWADGIYAQKKHSQINCTPAERWLSWTGEIRRVSNERSLDLLLAEAPDGEFRTVQKKGIQIEGYYYIAPELGDPNIMRSRVRVLLDPLDLGRVIVLDSDFRFICIAEAPELRNVDRQAVAVAANRLQQTRIQSAREALRTAGKKVRLVDALEHHLQIAAEKAQVIPFDVKAIPYQTPALDSIQEAIDLATETKAPQSDNNELEQATARIKLLNTEEPKVEEPWERYSRLVVLAPDQITETDRVWMSQFELTPEGKALLSVLAEEDEAQSISSDDETELWARKMSAD